MIPILWINISKSLNESELGLLYQAFNSRIQLKHRSIRAVNGTRNFFTPFSNIALIFNSCETYSR